VSQTTDPDERLADIESELASTLDRTDDDEQRYHIRKAAQRLVLAQESADGSGKSG